MKTFAVITGPIVSNIIVADDETAGPELGVTLIEYTPENSAGIGYTYDTTTGRFMPPEPVVDDTIV